ncbi:hypothetical protein Bca4012_020375 [Brassica carinata]
MVYQVSLGFFFLVVLVPVSIYQLQKIIYLWLGSSFCSVLSFNLIIYHQKLILVSLSLGNGRMASDLSLAVPVERDIEQVT